MVVPQLRAASLMRPDDPGPSPGQVLWPNSAHARTYHVPFLTAHIRRLHVTDPCLVLDTREFMGGRAAHVVLSDGTLHYVILEMLEFR